MRLPTLLLILISPFSLANGDDFVEIVTDQSPTNELPKYPPLEVGTPELKPEVSNLLPELPSAQASLNSSLNTSFSLNQGLLKDNIERMTVEFLPEYSVVWQVDPRIEQFANLNISGTGYYDLLSQIVKQYGIGACVRANKVIEIYNIQNNRFYCED